MVEVHATTSIEDNKLRIEVDDARKIFFIAFNHSASCGRRKLLLPSNSLRETTGTETETHIQVASTMQNMKQKQTSKNKFQTISKKKVHFILGALNENDRKQFN